MTRVKTVLLLVILVGISGLLIMSKDFGIKVSQDGKSALTGEDSEMVMNSNFNMFKIVKKDSLTVSKEGFAGQGTVISYHGLGFKPAVMAYINLVPDSEDRSFPIPYVWADTVTPGYIAESVQYTITDEVFRVDVYTPNSGSNPNYDTPVTYRITVYYLQETIE